MNISIESAGITDDGLGPKRGLNEDSYLILEKERVFAVADGVGGAQAGNVASQTAMQAIEKVLVAEHLLTKISDPIALAKSLINISNKEVYQAAHAKKNNMASTIALLLINEEASVIAHVGDSRVYLYRDSKLLQLTRDHSKMQNLIDNLPPNTIDKKNFQQKNIITKALGAKKVAEPDIQKVNLKDQDIFVLCTDGIYNHNCEDEILLNLKNNFEDLNKVCSVFKDTCYAKGAEDHLTAIVLKVTIEASDNQDTIYLKGAAG